MGDYYYLAASLPPLAFPGQAPISSSYVQWALETNLTPFDLSKVEALRLFVDISNIRPLLQAEEIDPRGNLSEKELHEALLDKVFFPQYVFDFLDKRDTLEEKLEDFSLLLAQFFREQTARHTGFLHDLFTFERERRLVTLALRAKALQRDVLKELRFEDQTDPLVIQILSQKDAKEYDPPAEYREIKERLHSAGKDPLEQSKAMTAYGFYKIEEMKEKEFSLDWILAYLAQLLVLEHWNELDQAKGRIILGTFKTS